MFCHNRINATKLIKHLTTSTNTTFNISSCLSLLQNPTCLKSIHAQIITNSLPINIVATKLINAYSDSGNLDYARKVFDKSTEPNTVIWNSMINAYLRNERYRDAIEFFREMRGFGVEVDSYTCNFALKACRVLKEREMGLEVVKVGTDKGVGGDPFFGSSVVNFLVSFGDVDEARRVFNGMEDRDVVCWNTMIAGYVSEGCYIEGFDLFFEMCRLRVRPSGVTMMSLIKGCCGLRDLRVAKCVHGVVFKVGAGGSTSIMVLTSLVDMYGKLGDVGTASRVFGGMVVRNLVSWNAMISVYIQNGLVHEAFDLFRMLVVSDGRFDSGTMVSLVQGCTQIGDLGSGKVLHGCIVRRGVSMNQILGTAIVDLYAKCGALKQANHVFETMKDKNVITWTAMLVGLSQNGHAEKALTIFQQMQEAGVAANVVTLTGLVHSCAHLGSLKKGKSVHAYIIRRGFSSDLVRMTALVDMYARCGKLSYAECVFDDGLVCKDTILWNCMISGYGMHGHGLQAVGFYRKMIAEGVKPNGGTFVSLLTACSHSGLVKEGINLFHSMESDHNIKPTDKHYASLVDLLSRAGRLKEAEAVINQMPLEPTSAVFEALLSGCRTHKNIDLGIHTADKLLKLDTMNPGIYIMLSNIYASVRKWDAVNYTRRLMRKQGLKKTPGYSSIEVGDQVHTFFAQDDSNQNWLEIYRLLERLRSEVEAFGYVPETSGVLRDVDELMKIKLLWGHSERLAIAFGILNTPAGSLIRITKNLRVCVDCHNVTKYITKVVKREIIVRDANRFHHFIDGSCSCNDYW